MRARFVLPLVLLLSLSVAGCSKRAQPTQSQGGGGGGSADHLVSKANTSLGLVIAALVAGPDPNRPSDVDFSQPYTLYQQALSLDPNHQDAKFGVSVLGLLSLTTDASVNAAFDEWAAYLAAHVPFEVPSGPRPLDVPVRLGRARDALRLPLEVPALSLLALANPRLRGADPQLRGVQDIFELRVLPILAESMSRLGSLATDPGYRFIVTPEMQGDPGADPIEIDRTDILALRAGCGLLAALCDIAVAYDLNFAAYDSAGLVSAVSPGSNWLKLRSIGAARLDHAKLSLLGAITDGEASLTSLLAETDDQSDDAIKIDPSDFTRASAESLKVYLGHARTALQSGFTITADWDGDGATPDVPLEIHPSALLDNPIRDWKAKLPGYSAGAVRRPALVRYEYGAGNTSRSASAPSSGYYSGGYWIYVYAGGRSESGYGSAFLQTAARDLLFSRLATFQANPLWAGYYYASTSFAGNLSGGTQSVPFEWYETYTVATAVVFVPTVTWNATSFGGWVWPDPDFNGLLPTIGSTSQLLSLFGYGASDWQRTVVLDWTDAVPRPAP